jgi:hypothetical protein
VVSIGTFHRGIGHRNGDSDEKRYVSLICRLELTVH